MAATVTGVFRIIDRASPAMRGMERQALRTDAAIASVGASLDTVGSRRQLRGLETAARDVRTLGVEAENFERRGSRAARALRQIDGDGRRARLSLASVGGAFRSLRFMLKPTLFLGIGSAIGVLVQTVGALAGGLISLTPRIVDLTGFLAPATAGFVGLGLAITTTKMAFSGLSQAMSGNKKALAELTPEGRTFLAHLRSYKPVLTDLRRASQRGLFPGLDAALARLQRGVPTLRGLLSGMGRREGAFARNLATDVTTTGALQDFQTIGSQGERMFTRLGKMAIDFLGILRNFAVAAQPFTDWLTSSIQMWVRHRREVSLFNRDSGRTAAFLDRSRRALTNFWHIAQNLWGTFRNLGRASRPLGDSLWRSAEKTTASWERMTRTNVGLTRDFINMRAALHEIFAIVGGLTRGIFRMGADPGLPRTLQSLRAVGSSLEKTLSFLANKFGPALAHLLGTIGDTVSGMTGVTGPFALMISLLDKTLAVVNGITHAVPGMGRVFGIALDVFLIQRFLVKLGLLQAGWLGVGRAARVAAVEEGRALALGGVAGAAGIAGGLRGRVTGAAETAILAGAYRFPRAGGALLGAGGMLRGLAGKGLRGGLYGLLAAPLAQGLVGSVTGSQRAGSIAGGVAGGAALGFTVGGPIGALVGGAGGGLFSWLHGRGGGSMSAARVAMQEKIVQRQLSMMQSYPTQLGRMVAELHIYQNAQTQLQRDRSKEAQMAVQQMQAEIDARRSVISQLRAERQQRIRASAVGRARGIESDLEKLYGAIAPQMGNRGAIDRLNRIAYRQLGTFTNPAARLTFARSFLRFERGAVGGGDPLFQRTRSWMAQLVPGLIQPGRAGFRPHGTAAEFDRIIRQMNPAAGRGGLYEAYRQRQSRAPTPLQAALIAELVVAGWPGGAAAAASRVMAADATGHSPLASAAIGRFLAARSGFGGAAGAGVVAQAARGWNPLDPLRAARAGGGRIPGRGLSDTVPVAPGAMAAPGELIVNRHQEAAADAGLGMRGALAGIVHRIRKPHRENYAAGGRVAAGTRFGGATILSPAWYARTVALGRWMAGLGYDVGENPAFGGVHPVHVPKSYHYIGQALDVNAERMPGGEMSNLDRLWGTLSKRAGSLGLSELIWRAKGHWDHLHVALGAGVGGRSTYFPGAAGIGAGAQVTAGAPAALGAAGIGAGASVTAGRRGGGVGADVVTRGSPIGREAARLAAARALMGFPASVYAAGGGGGGGGVGSAAGVAGIGASASATSTTGSANMRLGRRMMLAAGFGADQWAPLRALWTGESSWSTSAMNPSSRAQGIPQILPMKGRAIPPGFPDTPPLNAAAQIAWGLSYIRGRYGTPSAAYSAWTGRHPHWYQQGGRTPFAGWYGRGGQVTADRPTLVGIGERGRETATITPARRGAGPAIPATVTINGGVHVRVEHPRPGDVHDAVLAEVDQALEDFARELRRTTVEQGG